MTTPTSLPDLPADGYVLARTSEEYQRLRRQARFWEPVTALDRVGIGPGMRCPDVGCGPGEVMRLMAQRVGPCGGRDRAGQRRPAGPRGARSPARYGHRPVRVHPHRCRGHGRSGRGAFDLVYARLLLHTRDPVAMVRKLYAWTRPGGVMLVQDYDCHPMSIVPPLATWEEFERVFYGVPENAGLDMRIGQKLPLRFAAAGVGQPDGTDVAGLLLSPGGIGGMFEADYQSMRPLEAEAARHRHLTASSAEQSRQLLTSARQKLTDSRASIA